MKLWKCQPGVVYDSMPQAVALLMEEVSIRALFSPFDSTEGNYALHTHTFGKILAAAKRL